MEIVDRRSESTPCDSPESTRWPSSIACRRRLSTVAQIAVLLILTLLALGDVLVKNDRVLSMSDGDGSDLFLGLRDWGFTQIRHGHLPLWNPHLFCGTAFVGGYQSAMFYPFNLLYVFMPVERAFNLDIALHIWLSGVFMLLWLR